MFKGIGQFANLLKAMPRMKEEMEKLQQRISTITAEGAAGGGMVTARVNGKLEVLSCTITDDALKLDDKELLEDLIKGAVNQALERARALVAEETTKMAGGLGLPGLPGIDSFSGLMGS